MMPQATPSPATLPGSPAGNPAGPGSSPMAAPGGGEGNQAAARASLKAVYPVLLKVFSAFPAGSEDADNMMDAIRKISKIVGNTENAHLVPSAIQQMALAAKQGGPLKGAPPVGIQPANANIAPKEEPEPI